MRVIACLLTVDGLAHSAGHEFQGLVETAMISRVTSCGYVMNSKFLKTTRRFAQALAMTVFLTAIGREVVAQEAPNKVGWANSTDGVRIAYEVHGEGSLALVFVHGWSCNRSYWAGQLEPFSRGFEVVALDLAGHGDSGIGRKQWTIQSYGDDVAAVVKKLDLKRVVLIGHSMGGDVIPEAALRLPGRVVGLIWVDTYKKLGQGRSPEEVQAFVAKLRRIFLKQLATWFGACL